MGMLQAGRWSEDDQVTEAGTYVRPQSVFGEPVSAAIKQALASEPGRFHLIGSWSCPWSHRSLLVRQVKSLTEMLPIHMAHGVRVQGYPADGGKPWRVPGTDQEIVHLHQLYTLSDPDYSGRVTVPVLWDACEQRIVSNESSHIMAALDSIPVPDGGVDFTLRPDGLNQEIDHINQRIYDGLSNAVYRAAFATTQGAFETAEEDVFSTLDHLENHLASRRFLMGSVMTEADLRLFPTLFRFDTVYAIQHYCIRRRLTDYPNLWAYARDLNAWPGVAQAVPFHAMLQASFGNDPVANAHNIIPLSPDADWLAPHNRDSLGPVRLSRREKDPLVETRPLLLEAS